MTDVDNIDVYVECGAKRKDDVKRNAQVENFYTATATTTTTTTTTTAADDDVSALHNGTLSSFIDVFAIDSDLKFFNNNNNSNDFISTNQETNSIVAVGSRGGVGDNNDEENLSNLNRFNENDIDSTSTNIFTNNNNNSNTSNTNANIKTNGVRRENFIRNILSFRPASLSHFSTRSSGGSQSLVSRIHGYRFASNCNNSGSNVTTTNNLLLGSQLTESLSINISNDNSNSNDNNNNNNNTNTNSNNNQNLNTVNSSLTSSYELIINTNDPIVIRGDGNITIFGLFNKFSREFPVPLNAKIAPEEYRETIDKINKILKKELTNSIKWLIFGSICCCCTLGCSLLPVIFINKKTKLAINKLLQIENERIYKKLGIRWRLAKRKLNSGSFLEYVLLIDILPILPLYQPD